MKKKIKKKSKTQLTHKADKLYSKSRREQIGYCECCGKRENLQLAHIISRSIRKLRYHDDNTFVLCYHCHFSFHNKPLMFAEFVKSKKGEGVYHWLMKESNKLKTISDSFYEDIINKYK